MEKEILEILNRDIEKFSKELLTSAKLEYKRGLKKTENDEEFWMESIQDRSSRDSVYDKKVLLVVTTQKSENEYRKTEEYRAIEKLIYDQTILGEGNIELRLSLEVVENNKTGLSEVYNDFITEEYRDYYVCFIHDDVILNDCLFFEKLQEAHRTFEVVGVAGATNLMLPFNEKRATMWNELCKDEHGQAHAAGQVIHQNDGKSWASHYGNTPAFGKLIDGILMSFDVDKCLDYDFEFDTRFTFHHYDLAASIRALKCGFSIGIVPIMVTHKSIGAIDETWVQSHKKFVNAYRDYGKESVE